MTVWQWQEQHDWRIYDPTVSNFLEKSRVGGKTLVSVGDVCSALATYDVDLKAMKQPNKITGLIHIHI